MCEHIQELIIPALVAPPTLTNTYLNFGQAIQCLGAPVPSSAKWRWLQRLSRTLVKIKWENTLSIWKALKKVLWKLVSHLHNEGIHFIEEPEVIPVPFALSGNSPTKSITGRKCALTTNSCAGEQ